MNDTPTWTSGLIYSEHDKLRGIQWNTYNITVCIDWFVMIDKEGKRVFLFTLSANRIFVYGLDLQLDEDSRAYNAVFSNGRPYHTRDISSKYEPYLIIKVSKDYRSTTQTWNVENRQLLRRIEEDGKMYQIVNSTALNYTGRFRKSATVITDIFAQPPNMPQYTAIRKAIASCNIIY